MTGLGFYRMADDQDHEGHSPTPLWLSVQIGLSIMNLTWAKKGQKKYPTVKCTVFSLWWLCLLPFHPLTADLEAKAGKQKNDQNADQNASNNKCGITGFSPNPKLDFPLECFKMAAINFQCCITNVGPIVNPLIESSEVFSQTILNSQYFWKWTNANPIKIFGRAATASKL